MNINNTEVIAVDFSEPRYIKLNVKQGDSGVRHYVFRCTNKGVPVAIDGESIYATLNLKRPDGTYVIKECTILSGGDIDLEIDGTITKLPGICTSEIALFEKTGVTDKNAPDEEVPGNTVATMNIIINVFPSAIDDCGLEASNDFSALNDLVSKMLRDYRFIADECSGIIRSVKTINGHSPDENGEYTLQESDFEIVLDILSTKLEEANAEIEKHLLLSGGTMTGDINMGSHKISGIPTIPESDTDAVNKAYVDSVGTGAKNASLPKAGGQMSGGIDMNGNAVSNLSAPENDADAATKEYVDTAETNAKNASLPKAGGTMTGDLDMGGMALKNLKAPSAGTDAATKTYVDGKRAAYTATLGTGWTGSGPYTQTVAVSGILATDMPHITPVYDAANATAIAQKEAWNCVSKAEAAAGGIKFTCFENKPTTAIPIQIEVTR